MLFRSSRAFSAAEVQLSGLAAEDARDPQIMMAGFVLLGAGTIVFGAGLGRVAAPPVRVKSNETQVSVVS